MIYTTYCTISRKRMCKRMKKASHKLALETKSREHSRTNYREMVRRTRRKQARARPAGNMGRVTRLRLWRHTSRTCAHLMPVHWALWFWCRQFLRHRPLKEANTSRFRYHTFARRHPMQPVLSACGFGDITFGNANNGCLTATEN